MNSGIFTSNPYRYNVISPYGLASNSPFYQPRPLPGYHARFIHQTLQLNNTLNREAQARIDALEPRSSIWDIGAVGENPAIPDSSPTKERDTVDNKSPHGPATGLAEDMSSVDGKPSDGKGDKDHSSPLQSRKHETRQRSALSSSTQSKQETSRPSKFSSLKKSLGIKSAEEKAAAEEQRSAMQGLQLRNAIVEEEQGRWPDHQWRYLVDSYQEKVGMVRKIQKLRETQPIQYLHLLRAGYFEPIPIAWANQASNPLKFSIEAAAGWRGITPAWRGYEDTAEERLYWVLNHREGSAGTRLKPDFISALNMARARMATAVEPPPQYYSNNDTCHLQHTSAGYSKQVMPSPFRAVDQPESPSDDTMILLDVSGSMDFDPVRPRYEQYLITGYDRSTQPKNKGTTLQLSTLLLSTDH